ncbi:MAG: S41 family peptidase [Hyphomonadaceae bacterium]|nr:S41 family peptidase [Hyphomonadaceae bacterium]
MPFDRAIRAGLLAAALLVPAAHAQATLDDATRSAVVAKAADALRNRYIFPDVGEKAAAKLEASLAAGAYKDLAQPGAFAEQLTKDLYEVAKDKHMRVSAPGPRPAPAGASAPQPPPKSEGGVVRADRLAGDIGYIEISGFPPPGGFKPPVDKAMAQLADTKALIVDIRRNGGGSPDSVAYLVSFFLDGAKPPMLINDFVNRKPNTTEFTTRQSFSVTTPTSYLGKPVYVLTSPRTFSGGEEFAYDMQAFKLGTLIGETTGGGANPGGVMPIGSQLGIFMPNGRPVNPVTKTNWEGIGVIPDIPTPVEDALKVALEKLGQKPAAKDIDTLSQAKLFQPRTTASPGLDALARKVIEGDAKGEPALDIMAPGLAQAAQAQRDSLLKTYARLGALKSLTFQGPGPAGGDTYLAAFAYGSRNISISLGADGKVAGFFIGGGPPPTDEQRQAAFKAIDLNADGKVDPPEYKTMLATIGVPDRFDDLFAQVDADKNGIVSLEEYRTSNEQ